MKEQEPSKLILKSTSLVYSFSQDFFTVSCPAEKKYDSLQNYNEEYNLRFKAILVDIFLDLTSCLSLKSTVSILGIYRCWNNT